MKETISMKAIIAPVAALAVLAAPAFAADLEVEFDRSLLSSAEGREAILEMFEQTAYDFCTTEATNQRALIATSTCFREMVDQFVENADDEILAQMHVEFDTL